MRRGNVVGGRHAAVVAPGDRLDVAGGRGGDRSAGADATPGVNSPGLDEQTE